MTTSVFAGVLAQGLAGWLLTYAIHSTILLGVAALLAARFREQHAWLDWLWKVALIGSVVTATAQSVVGVQPLGGRWSPWPETVASGGGGGSADALVVHAREALRRQSERHRVGSSEGTRLTLREPPAERGGTGGSESAARSAHAPEDEGVFPTALIGSTIGFATTLWPFLLVSVWLLVAIGGVVRFVGRQRALYRMLGRRRPVEDTALLGALRELCEVSGLRRQVRLTVTPRCMVPVALLRGEVVVPERFLNDLDSDQQRAALAHEVAHQIRRDPQWLLLAFLLETIFFFQPLQQRARRALRENAEVLCDDWAVQQTFPLGVARCLREVAEWVAPTPEWQLTAASWMACGDSPLFQRVERVLRAQRVRPARGSLIFATFCALPLLLLIAPVISSADVPTSASVRTRLPVAAATVQPTAASLPARLAQQSVIRAPRPADPLEARWAWALAEAARRQLPSFWVVYSFYRPASVDQQFISDSHLSDQLVGMTRLGALLAEGDLGRGSGNIGALFHFTGTDDRSIDRMGHRSLSIGFDFADEPVFWLGSAAEAQSLARLEHVFGSVTAPELLEEVVETYGIHPTTDRVLPFLTRMLEPEMIERVRAEAAESLENHADPRVVPLLVGTVRTDPSVHVRSEAAEALGEVHVPQAIPALLDLAQSASDTWLRGEAAEALGDQAPGLALPALLRLIDSSRDAHVRLEAVEAIGELQTKSAGDALVRLIWEHDLPDVRREAVEVLADYRSFGILEHLDRILMRHDDERVLEEALEVLSGLNDPRADQRIARAARSSRSPVVRREALELLGEAQERTDRRAGALTAEQLEVLLERAIFDDADRSVQLEAIDVAAESLPRVQARRLLRRVADEHPVRGIRAEALDELEDID